MRIFWQFFFTHKPKMTKKSLFQISKSELKLEKMLDFFINLIFFVICGYDESQNFFIIFLYVYLSQKNFFYPQTKNDKNFEI